MNGHIYSGDPFKVKKTQRKRKLLIRLQPYKGILTDKQWLL